MTANRDRVAAVHTKDRLVTSESKGRFLGRGLEEERVVRIQPSRGWAPIKMPELWAYRELLFFLIWRDVKVRYKQTVLGAGWAIIQPLFTMAIFTLVFGRLARIPSEGVPYPIFAYTALVPWTLFANALTQVSNSLVGSANLIKKAYFPRLLLPISAVLGGLVDFVPAFAVLIGLLLYFGIIPTIAIAALPLFLLLALITSLGVGVWFAALHAQYRDIRHLVPFVIQLWLFATPIAYPSSLLSEPWRTLYGLNPMAGIVEGFRWAILGTGSGPGPMLAVSALAAVLLLVSGAFYFRRMERTYADLI